MSSPLLHWRHDQGYANWKMVHWTWTATEDRKTVLYFILSPDGKSCALVRNGLALYTFGSRGAHQDREFGCQSAVSDALDDDTLGAGFDHDEQGRSIDDEEDADQGDDDEDDDEDEDNDDDDEDDDEDELVGLEIVDFSNLSLELSPSGNFAVFTIEKNGHSFIFQLQGQQRQPSIAGELIASSFPDRGDGYFLTCKSEDGEHFFIHCRQHFDGILHDCAFSASGEHSVAIFSPDVATNGEEPAVSVLIDGKVLLTAARIQTWNYPGEAGSETYRKKRFEFDPEDRYLIFGTRFRAPDRRPGSAVLALQVFIFADGKFAEWPGVRILSSYWNAHANVFELNILSSSDGYSEQKSMQVPFIETEGNS